MDFLTRPKVLDSERILDLTRLELADMARIRERFFDEPVWFPGPRGATHRKLFLFEDVNDFDPTLMWYLPELGGLQDELKELVDAGVVRKAYMTAICFKAR